MLRHQLQQGTRLKGFYQVIHGTIAHCLNSLLHSAISGHQQNRQVRVLLTQIAQQPVAVHPRHIHIADHHAYRLALQQSQCSIAITGLQCVITAQGQGIAQGFSQSAIILNQ